MGLHKAEMEAVRTYHPSIRGLSGFVIGDWVNAIAVDIEGRRGGFSPLWWWGPKKPQRFEVLVDTTNLQAGLPTAWIGHPTNREIRHVNVLRPAACPFLENRPLLPRLCWGPDVTRRWAGAAPAQRTLGALLEFVRQILNHQNTSDRAR